MKENVVKHIYIVPLKYETIELKKSFIWEIRIHLLIN